MDMSSQVRTTLAFRHIQYTQLLHTGVSGCSNEHMAAGERKEEREMGQLAQVTLGTAWAATDAHLPKQCRCQRAGGPWVRSISRRNEETAASRHSAHRRDGCRGSVLWRVCCLQRPRGQTGQPGLFSQEMPSSPHFYSPTSVFSI